jgi:hypothetical protein
MKNSFYFQRQLFIVLYRVIKRGEEKEFKETNFSERVHDKKKVKTTKQILSFRSLVNKNHRVFWQNKTCLYFSFDMPLLLNYFTS